MLHKNIFQHLRLADNFLKTTEANRFQLILYIYIKYICLSPKLKLMKNIKITNYYNNLKN